MNSLHVLRPIVRPRNVVSVFRRSRVTQAKQDHGPGHKKTWDLMPEERDQMAQDRFHEVMRRFPRPVVVVTTFDCPKLVTDQETRTIHAEVPAHWSDQDVSATTNITDREQQIRDPQQLAPIARAMTVSSFTSLSMKPKPMVLFNCSIPSRTHRAILNSGIFAVHVLSADMQGAQIADLFARGQEDHQPPSAAGSDIQELHRARLGTLSQVRDLGVTVTAPEYWHHRWAERFRYLDSASEQDRRSKWGLSPPQLDGPGVLYRMTCRVVNPRFGLFSPNPDSAVSGGFALIMGIVTFVKPMAEARLSKTTLSYLDGAYRGESEIVLKHKVAGPTAHNPTIPTVPV